jgi:hypothetical protein
MQPLGTPMRNQHRTDDKLWVRMEAAPALTRWLDLVRAKAPAILRQA